MGPEVSDAFSQLKEDPYAIFSESFKHNIQSERIQKLYKILSNYAMIERWQKSWLMLCCIMVLIELYYD